MEIIAEQESSVQYFFLLSRCSLFLFVSALVSVSLNPSRGSYVRSFTSINAESFSPLSP
uniref:Uncharacterized protein n=1 Tax=Anguilla anguilla TaxID=7936 RepID=A0A0E9QYF3_ANGAN